MVYSGLKPSHARMPAILPPDVYGVWLDPEAPPEVLTGRSRPYPSEVTEATPVATAVNGPGNDEPARIKPI